MRPVYSSPRNGKAPALKKGERQPTYRSCLMPTSPPPPARPAIPKERQLQLQHHQSHNTYQHPFPNSRNGTLPPQHSAASKTYTHAHQSEHQAGSHPLKVWLRYHVSEVVSMSSTSSDRDAAKTTDPVEASSSCSELSMGFDSSASTGWISTPGIPREANRSWTYLAICGVSGGQHATRSTRREGKLSRPALTIAAGGCGVLRKDSCSTAGGKYVCTL